MKAECSLLSEVHPSGQIGISCTVYAGGMCFLDMCDSHSVPTVLE